MISAVEEGTVNGLFRRLSFMVPPIKPRVTKARHKSFTHLSSKFESLDYDVWTNELLVKEEQCRSYHQVVKVDILRWILFLLVGIFTGLVAVFINISIKFLHDLQFQFVLQYMQSCTTVYCEFMNFVLWYLVFGSFTLLGTALVVFVEPGAGGSGIPFIVSYLNGVFIPHITTLRVLLVKAIGVIFACVAGLATGKEGPYIHIGSIIGGIIMDGAHKLKIPWLQPKLAELNNSREKRDLIAAGFAAGVSAAFGSPVGATLLSLEEGTSFWSVMLMWRIFFCAVASTFTFNSLTKLILDDHGLGIRLFRFGRFGDDVLDYSLTELPLFFLVGVIGGGVGAFYVYASSKVTFYRKRFINSPTLQLLDSAVLSLVTAIFGIVSIYSWQSCISVKVKGGSEFRFQLTCPEGFYNEMSAFWLQSQENLLKLIFQSDIFLTENLILYCILYFLLFIMINGIQIPTGIFIPALVVGATWGRIFGLILLEIFPQMPATVPMKYALLGAAAQLGGLLRTTLSLSILLVEASGSIIFAFPLMFTLLTTKWVGDFFTESLYKAMINIMGVPLLPVDPPPLVSDIEAKDLMNTKVVSFPTIVSVHYILEVLGRVKHQGFPVINECTVIESNGTSELRLFGELRGFIYRHQLMTILHCKLFSSPETPEQVEKIVSLFRKYENASVQIQNLNLNEDEKLKIIDLKPFMNPSPYSAQTTMSFPRIFRLLRSLGLRHVIIVNNTNQVVGIISRKDLAKYRCWRHAASMGLKELRIR